jgi:uncharacterized glyoxalase superfamily protein PhnB
MVDSVEPVAAFYLTHFGFKSLFTSDWYVHVQSEANPVVNFGILQANHESIPASKRGVTGGALLSFEVADVDAEYARLKSAGLPMLLDIKSEDFGQRHFITTDPGGTMIDIITPIAPSAEFAGQYAPEALPG